MTPPEEPFDTVILGAGAAGMMCAAQAASRGGRVLVLDRAANPGEKIRISGGGRCNFTNLHCGPENFLSDNPHFAKSALARFSQWDFIALMDAHRIAWHEKALGQLFCDGSAKQVVAMLRELLHRAGAKLWLRCELTEIAQAVGGFRLDVTHEGTARRLRCRNFVVASGGKSIPKMGATGRGYAIAEQFGIAQRPTRPALVPFAFTDGTLDLLRSLAGLSVDAVVRTGDVSFREGMLFTHRGLSGPSILQLSSYWRPGRPIQLDLLPGGDLAAQLARQRQRAGRVQLATALTELLPKRLASALVTESGLKGNLADQSDAALTQLAETVHNWQLTPAGTEGYRTAEVTAGGIDTDALDARSMQARKVEGLYFIGEVVDVTGWLGGFNFQWAWSSGWAAGTAIAAR
ncbi:NAD(P)/FAD-dependent oxidoreductase [Brevirhabdus sp.]|uniref:NAD(P)/FAD-dependent oxidoreductase n=1 Tax=Brevirhabdus sp. TaxID=2004514 RepID=UPI004058D6C4